MFYWVFAATLRVIYEPLHTAFTSHPNTPAALCFVASNSILTVDSRHSSEILFKFGGKEGEEDLERRKGE